MSAEQPNLKDDEPQRRPGQELDVTHNVIDSATGVDEFLERNNLGLGFYEDNELWQQVERYHDGMYGRAAFSEKITRKAIDETIRALGREGKTFFDNRDMDVVSRDGWADLKDKRQEEIQSVEADTEYDGRRDFIRSRGEEIWRRMEDDDRLNALELCAGIDRQWTPPHLRILVAQHDMSRSKGARLLDNYFGRKHEKKVETSGDSAGRLLGGNR